MYNLIVKDIKLQKTMIMAYIFMLFLYQILGNPISLGAFITGVLLLVTAAGFDERNKAFIMLNSLPLSRKTIVNSRYLSIILFAVAATVLSIMAKGVVLAISGKLAAFTSFEEILFTIMGIVVFSLVYLPLYYKFGQRYMTTILMIVFVLVILLGRITLYLLDDKVNMVLNFLKETPAMQLSGFAVAVTALLFFLSWGLSVRIYSKKDF